MDPDDRSFKSMDLRDAIRDSRTHLHEMEKEESSETGYQTRLWGFVRELRGHPELRDLKAREALSAICNAANFKQLDKFYIWSF